MGYQALLFCPDEKLARVISQVFSELDFAIDPVNEPFAAVKKLMAQRYDAIVVDCDNEQNTSLLFKSARNSSFNQASLAIALVEGQAGVAKAYRIGANLVLTKPINVEQAKGTLRVARGLLRKGSENAPAAASAGQAVSAKTATTPVPRPVQPARQVTPVIPPAPPVKIPEVKSPLPSVVASATPEEKPAAPTATAPESLPVLAEPVAKASSVQATAVELEQSKAEQVKPPVAPVVDLNLAATSQGGAAAAPAPAKEITANEVKDAPKEKQAAPAKERKEELHKLEPATMPEYPSHPAGVSAGPTFAALGVEDTNASSGSKKIFVGVAVLLVLVATAYFGWTKLGQSHPAAAPQPAIAAPQQPQPESRTPPQLAPMSSPAPAPSNKVDRASASNPPHTSKTSASQPSETSAGNSAGEITLKSEPEVKKSSEAPIRVKAQISAGKTQNQTEEAAAMPPSPLGVESSSDANLNGILSSSNVATPTLNRIKVSQGVSQGLLIKRVPPKYPPAALAARAEGTVVIEATINQEGNVVNPKVVKGDRVLAAAAIEAVRQWRYKPYYLDGVPVEIQTEITINFKAN
jgi:TonB family protein